ncbi:tetratricopeptide repeat protein, partial [Halomonas sp. SIMBA_159]
VYLDRAIQLSPQLGIAHYNLGLVTLQKDDPEAALEHFRNAQKYRSQAPEIFYQMGLAYLKLEKLDQAKTAFEAVIRLQS